MTQQRLSFAIRGKIASDHRRVVSRFDQQGRPRAKPLIYLKRDYQDFRKRAHLAGDAAMLDGNWRTPPRRTKIVMRLRFHVATKQPGKRNPLKTVYRKPPDKDNMEKCVLDSLQDERRKRQVVWYGLYHNDRDVVVLPLEGRQDWIDIFPGLAQDEFVEVEIESPRVTLGKQLELAGTCARRTR